MFIARELGSLFGGRPAQGSTSKDASIVRNSGFATDENPTEIFAHKPSPPYVPPTHKDPITGQIVQTILNPDAIEKLEPEALLEYISNFNPDVKAARDALRAADLEVEKAENELFNDAISEYKRNNEPRRKGTLAQPLKEPDDAKIPDSAQKIIQQYKTNLKSAAHLGTTDEELDKIAMKQFAQAQHVSFTQLEFNTEVAQEARHRALELARLRKTSGE